MKNDFKEGDVVVLKSGGPWMTVCKVNDRHVQCDWFDGNVRHNGTFIVAAIKKLSS